MANTAANVRVGSPEITAEGYIRTGPIGTKTPTTLAEPLEAALKGIGYVSEEGVNRNLSTETENIKDWNLDTVKVVVTDSTATYTFTMIQDDIESARLLFGAANVVEGTDGEYTILHKGDPLEHRAWVVLMKDGENGSRHVIDDGQITSIGEQSYVKNGVVSYEVTLTCFRVNGAFVREIKKDAVRVVA